MLVWKQLFKCTWFLGLSFIQEKRIILKLPRSCSNVQKSQVFLLLGLEPSKAIKVKCVYIKNHISKWTFRVAKTEIYLEKNASLNNSIYQICIGFLEHILKVFYTHIFSMKFHKILFQNIFSFGCTVIFKGLTRQKSKLWIKNNHTGN